MHIHNLQDQMSGATSVTPKRTGKEKQALDELRLSTPVLCSFVAMFFLGWVAGQWIAIPIRPIAAISGFVVLFIAWASACTWLESRARIVLADVARQARAGSLNVEEIERHFTN